MYRIAFVASFAGIELASGAYSYFDQYSRTFPGMILG